VSSGREGSSRQRRSRPPACALFPVKSKTGYSFPQSPSAGYDSVKSQFLMPDMMSDILLKKAKVADAVKETHDRMVKVFDQFGLKQ